MCVCVYIDVCIYLERVSHFITIVTVLYSLTKKPGAVPRAENNWEKPSLHWLLILQSARVRRPAVPASFRVD